MPPFHIRRPAVWIPLAFALGVVGADAQERDLLPGDGSLNPHAIAEHTATYRFIQYGQAGTGTEVGRLSRTVERVNHTADEPAVLVSMQFRNPTRSGLDIVYLDASTLGSLVRYLTAPTGLTAMYQMNGALHVTYAGRDGTRHTADTTLAHERFGGASDLVLAALEVEEDRTVRIPVISGAASTLAEALTTNTVSFEGRETIDVPGVWTGTARRYDEKRANGTSVTYWIADEGPHLIRQDFFDGSGRRFLRWELAEHGKGPGR